jgi:hypothetical protein
MATKLLFILSIILISVMQPTKGYSAFVTTSNSLPGGHHSCHPHYHYHGGHYHNDHFVRSFTHERNKNWTSWGAFFDYFCIGPVGAICGSVGLVKREAGAGIVMAIGLIETTVEAVCLSH